MKRIALALSTLAFLAFFCASAASADALLPPPPLEGSAGGSETTLRWSEPDFEMLRAADELAWFALIRADGANQLEMEGNDARRERVLAESCLYAALAALAIGWPRPLSATAPVSQDGKMKKAGIGLALGVCRPHL